jgi:hypothetical protein
MLEEEASTLRRRVEGALGWAEGDADRFDLPMLREMVREKSPKLHHLLGQAVHEMRLRALGRR